MFLPINTEELLSGNTIENERIEYKKGWNPEDVMHSLCAFANDISNLGGGYIVIGINEKNGIPILPPIGINLNQVESFQKKLLEISNKITPNYFALTEHRKFQGKSIFIIRAPGGDHRPYRAPKKFKKDNSSPLKMYVRRYSSTVMAKPEEEQQLYELAAKVPFDDRINLGAELKDLDINLIKDFLVEIQSELADRADQITFPALVRNMQIAKGPDEELKPINVGLLLFNQSPEKFFRGACIELITYKDEIGDEFTEQKFSGPIHSQLRNAIQHIKNQVISEHVKKVEGKAEASRFFNYPFSAIEEALSNAIYHKSYEHQSSIEVSIMSDRIEILSFPGPVPPVDNKMLKKEKIIARDYRNRRIGDFLKELHLTEGRATGIPKIRIAMKKNGSPEPVFETDEDKTYFLTRLSIHPYFVSIRSQKYEQIILEAVQEKEYLTKQDIKNLIYDQLSNVLSAKQKDNKINNLMYKLSRKRKAIRNIGTHRNPKYVSAVPK